MFKPIQRILRRIAHFAPGGFSLRPALHRWRGVKIGKGVWISQYVYIDEIHPDAVAIGDNVSLGLGTSIIAHMYWGTPKKNTDAERVVIGDDVFIGPHCVILPGVHIGQGAVVQAGTVVSRDVPPRVLYGSPASARPLAKVTTPLTAEHSYLEFARGLRPLRQKGGSDDHR